MKLSKTLKVKLGKLSNNKTTILDRVINKNIKSINFQPPFKPLSFKGNHLPEPSKDKIELLIDELSKFTKVKVKDNLKRLMK